MDIVDKAPVAFLAKNTVHTGVMADDDIIIGASDTRPSHSAYGDVIARGFAALERLITDGCVVVSGGAGGECFPTSGRVGTAGGIVHERKVTSGSVGGTAVVKDERISSNGGVLCAACVEQQRYSAHCGIGICGVEDQRSNANTSIETAGGIQKERPPTNRCISNSSSERIKCIAPSGRSEIGVAPRCRGWCRCWRGGRAGPWRGCRRGAWSWRGRWRRAWSRRSRWSGAWSRRWRW